jgi:CMP/dCMP kinase
VRRPVVTIDGPAGAGKSTASRALAQRLGFTYLDTGAIYRTVALAAQDTPGLPERVDAAAKPEDISPRDQEALAEHAHRLQIAFAAGGSRVLLAGRDVSDAIRAPEVSQRASKVSAVPAVRAALLDLQRRLAAGGGVVAEGRDVGSVVFPDAEVKFFLTADVAERARRRAAELRARGIDVEEERIRAEIEARDARDSGRATAPLVCPADALVIDSSTLAAEDVVTCMAAAVSDRERS